MNEYRSEDIEKKYKNVQRRDATYSSIELQINNFHSRAFRSWRADSSKPGGFQGFFCGNSGFYIWVHQPAKGLCYVLSYVRILPYEIFNNGQNLPLHMVKVHLSALAFDHLPRVLCVVGHKRADHNVQDDTQTPAVGNEGLVGCVF